MNVRQSLTSGQLDEIAPGVRRLVANNAGYMTGPGTNTYILGQRRFSIIDPGPLDEAHVERLLRETGGCIDAVLVTHTHLDHSPAAGAIAAETGARLLGRTAAGERQDETFHPTSVLADGDVIDVDGESLRAVHTPGHASNHLCYLFEASGLLFTGDHLMQGSTVVITPPDGNMGDYLRSLRRLQTEPVSRIAPGHGLTIENAQAEIARIIAHRLQREAKILERLGAGGPATLDGLVVRVYDDVDARLHLVAKGSLLAHLQKLADEGRVRCSSADADAVWMTP
jgi:glyoxylase-like metal-dependent hydrolase (beta-lactamase superfamily II)